MSNYRRFYLPNHLVFITLVTANRKPFLLNYLPELRTSIEQVKNKQPFNIIAMVVLPDHSHFIMDMPERNWNFSNRFVKEGFYPANWATDDPPVDSVNMDAGE